MKKALPIRILFAICLIATFLASCLNDKWFEEKSKKIAERTAKVGDSLATGLMLRITEKFNDTLAPSLKLKLAAILTESLDSVGKRVDARLVELGPKAAELRDSLLTEEIKTLVKDLIPVHFLGNKTEDRVNELAGILKGALPKKDYLAGMVDSAMHQILADTVLLQAAVAALLSDKFEDRTLSLVDSILFRLQGSVKTTKVEAEGFLDKVKKYAIHILSVLGLLLLGLGIFVAIKYRRYMKLIKTLTYQIHTIPDQTAYNKLTEKIEHDAKEKSIEPLLRKILKEQGLLGNWHPPKA